MLWLKISFKIATKHATFKLLIYTLTWIFSLVFIYLSSILGQLKLMFIHLKIFVKTRQFWDLNLKTSEGPADWYLHIYVVYHCDGVSSFQHFNMIHNNLLLILWDVTQICWHYEIKCKCYHYTIVHCTNCEYVYEPFSNKCCWYCTSRLNVKSEDIIIRGAHRYAKLLVNYCSNE